LRSYLKTKICDRAIRLASFTSIYGLCRVCSRRRHTTPSLAITNLL
jgi:hypothetical protein